MSMWVRRLTFVFFAWILWTDQSVYGPPGGQPQAPPIGEGTTGKWQQIAILPTQAACEAQRRPLVGTAALGDAQAAGHGRYGDRFRYFCSPIDDPSQK